MLIGQDAIVGIAVRQIAEVISAEIGVIVLVVLITSTVNMGNLESSRNQRGAAPHRKKLLLPSYSKVRLSLSLSSMEMPFSLR